MTVAALIQATAAVESLSNKIDRLAVLDAEAKRLEKLIKPLKAEISNDYGDGVHRGEMYGVRVTIENRKGSVDMKALCAAFGITDEQLDSFRGESSAIIKVAATA